MWCDLSREVDAKTFMTTHDAPQQKVLELEMSRIPVDTFWYESVGLLEQAKRVLANCILRKPEVRRREDRCHVFPEKYRNATSLRSC